jgi:ribosome-binding protein aMBF1 (putative translation factor)
MTHPSPGILIRNARKKNGMTQKTLAAKLRRGQSVVSKYERGAVIPPGNILMRCMKILEGSEQAKSIPQEIPETIRTHVLALSRPQLRSILVDLVVRLSR